MGIFSVRKSDSIEDISENIKNLIEIFKQHSYSKDYDYLIKQFLKKDMDDIINQCNEKHWLEFKEEAKKLNEMIQKNTGGNIDDYQKMIFTYLRDDCLLYFLEKDFNLTIEVVVRSCLFKLYNDHHNYHHYPTYTLNTLMKQFLDTFDPLSSDTSNLASTLEFFIPYFDRMDKILLKRLKILKDMCKQALTPTAKFLRKV